MTSRHESNETEIIQIQRIRDREFRRKLRLQVVVGENAGAEAVVDSGVAYIGTQAGNHLQLSDATVSGIHLEIRNTKNGLRLRDLGSTNGTWLDAVRVFEAVVPFGAVITMGHSRVRLDALDEQVAVPLSASNRFGRLVGQSELMRGLFVLLEKVAPTDETVLIVGETGTGKEVCARSIVESSPRRERPFVIFDCGAIPPGLMESELFGHARGSFTGAVAEHEGAFQRAHGGTIFLDEIGELPLELQTRLLRAVENRCIRRVGDGRDIPLDIRIVAATNRCLEEEVNRGTFRADLYYRLSVVQVRLPPLRERIEDIELIARELVTELSDEGRAVSLTPELLDQLRRHRWPGNVRELRNHLRRTALGHVPVEGLEPVPVSSGGGGNGGGMAEIDLTLTYKECKNRATEQFERVYLDALMRKAGGNISKAARMAQTDRTYLSRLLTKYGVKATD